MTTTRRAILFLLLLLTLPASASDPAAAVVNGRTITRSDLDALIAPRLTALEQQVYALRKSALDAAITTALVEDDARAKGISVDEWKRRTTGGEVTIAAAEIEKVFAENAALFATFAPEEARERIRLDLATQTRMRRYRDAVDALRAKASIDIRLEEPRVAHDEGEATAQSTGNAAAPVVITEFADFECPWCRQSYASIKQLLASQSDRVRFVYRHLPLDSHPQAMPAARASYCAGEQQRFWEFHDALYAAPLTAETPRLLAESLRLDLPRFDACVASDASRLAVAADVEAARRYGITSTPSFVINGRVVRGAATLDELTSVVQRELSSKGKS